MTMNNSSAQEIAFAVLQGKAVQVFIDLDILAEVDRILTARVDATRMRPLVVIYGIESRKAAVTYPLISKTRLNIRSDVPLEQKNLNRILHQPEVIGNILSASWKDRLKEDWKTLALAVSVFLVAMFILFVFSSPAATRYSSYLSNPGSEPLVQSVINFYQIVGQALLTIMTLFLTVFVLFTISQNADISKDANLYINGLFHKFIRDDLYITRTAAFSLLASALGLLLSAAPIELYSFSWQATEFNKLNTLIPLLFSFAAATFFISLTSLNYYARRVVTANESNLMKQILDEREKVAKPYRDQFTPSQNSDGQNEQ